MDDEFELEHHPAMVSVSSLVVHHKQFDDIQDMIRECLMWTRLTGEPNCLALEGPSGVGKTQLLRSFAETYQREYSARGVKNAAFYIQMPSPARIDLVSWTMLQQLGDPAADLGRPVSMDVRLKNFFRRLGVMLVMLDDFHHLINPDTDQIVEQVSDWLKALAKLTVVTFVVVGTEGNVSRILDTSPQLARLFTFRPDLLPFNWGTQESEYGSVLHQVESDIKMQIAPKMPRQEIFFRIHWATDGVIGHTMKLLRGAVRNALAAKRAEIDLEDLELSFQNRLAKNLKKSESPFKIKPNLAFLPPGLPPAKSE